MSSKLPPTAGKLLPQTPGYKGHIPLVREGERDAIRVLRLQLSWEVPVHQILHILLGGGGGGGGGAVHRVGWYNYKELYLCVWIRVRSEWTLKHEDSISIENERDTLHSLCVCVCVCVLTAESLLPH